MLISNKAWNTLLRVFYLISKKITCVTDANELLVYYKFIFSLRRPGERSRSGKALNENFVRLQKKKRFYGLGANARRRHGALGRGGISRFKRRRFWRLTHRSDTEAAGLGPDDGEEQAGENDDEDDDDDEDEQVDVVDEGEKEERREEESHDAAVEMETAGEERAEADSDVADGD